MTNTCELQFPSNYVLMDNDEMMYLDGGANGWWNSVGVVGGAIDVVLYLIPVIAQANASTKWGKSLCKALAAVGATKTKMINGAFTLLKKVGFSVSKTVVSSAIGAVWTFAGLSIGGLIAKGIDLVDKKKRNGYCFG